MKGEQHLLMTPFTLGKPGLMSCEMLKALDRLAQNSLHLANGFTHFSNHSFVMFSKY